MSTLPPLHRHHHRLLHLVVVLLALLVYIGIDSAALSVRQVTPNWGLRFDKQGTITWTDPNGLADGAGLIEGDRLALVHGAPRVSYLGTGEMRQPELLVQGHGWMRSASILGPTRTGQALVLVGVLLLLVGGLVWAFGRAGHAPALLGILSAMGSLTLLGYVWSHSGYEWAMRLGFVAGVVLFPLSWAAFFLSFPHNRLVLSRWRIAFMMLSALGVMTLLAYALCFLIGLPYVAVRMLSAPLFPLGLLFGLFALLKGGRGEAAQTRQQRRILVLSAGGAMLPALLFSFLPAVWQGSPLVPYQVTALAVLLLPLGIAYAIVRYNLMELDVMVRRAVSATLGSLILMTVTVAAALALRPLLPSLDLLTLAIAVLVGAAGGRYVWEWSRTLVERLLSPELTRSRNQLAALDAALLKGGESLEHIAACLEGAACAATGAAWVRLLVRCHVPGAVFRATTHEGAAEGTAATHEGAGAGHAALPRLCAALVRQSWGIMPGDGRGPDVPGEWRELSQTLGVAPALLMPLRLGDDVVAILAVGNREGGDRLAGPDREALALLTEHASLAVDHASTRAELEADGADAATLSAASVRLATALDDRAALPRHIVAGVAALRDVRGVSLLLYGADGTPTVAVEHGDAVLATPGMCPPDPATILFSSSPAPWAWLPLVAGGTLMGALCLRWSERHAIREHDRRLLTVYANGAAMALEHARLYERARIQAERDSVTDLYNYRAFHGHLEAALERARATGSSVGLLLIDVADFKLFNDTHGHQAGDQALRRVGEVLQACCHTSDVTARLGGDEFAVLLPNATIETAYAVAERITELAATSALMSPDGQQLPVRLTIGAAAFPADADAANALLARADERMYAAKRSGVSIATVPRTEEEAASTEGSGQFGILEALVAMVDNRDRYTAEHSEQVASYACAIAAELGLSSETIKTLRLAGLLHDVGKIGVPDRVLRKPDKLTDEEYDIVRRHVELSEALVMVISQDRDLLDAVRYHHERWDGRGYPRGTAGADVPLLGRIMIVADAVSAMGMDRPYRKGLSWSTISAELARGAGVQFDPGLVTPALNALRPYLERAQAA